MPDTITTNYNLVKPEINGSPNTWGNKLNGNSDVIDVNLKRVDDLATDAVLRAGSGSDPDEYIRGVLRYKDTVAPANNLDLVHIALLKAWITNASPIGSVITWGGTLGSIPNCWSLCDGSTVNGNLTPNLVDKFVLGAGTGVAPGSFGGSKTHDHGGLTGGTAITEAQMPSHTHSINDPGHLHAVNDPGHFHNLFIRSVQSGYSSGTDSSGGTTLIPTTTDARITGVYLSAAVTGITVVARGSGQTHNHTIASVNHLPPYYALAYIMRTKYPWDA